MAMSGSTVSIDCDMTGAEPSVAKAATAKPMAFLRQISANRIIMAAPFLMGCALTAVFTGYIRWRTGLAACQENPLRVKRQ